MALEIRTHRRGTMIVHTPLGDSQKQVIKECIVQDRIIYIVADGSEGANCIRAYLSMSGQIYDQRIDEIRGQVSYAGDIAESILLNLIHE